MHTSLQKSLLWAVLMLTCLTSWAAVAGLTGGVKVKSLSGSVQVQSEAGWRPLQIGEALSDGQRLRLAEGSDLQMIFRFDGHREIARGPGDLIVRSRNCEFAGKGELKAFDYRNRPVAITTSANIGVVGGRVESTRSAGPPKPIAQLQLETRPAALALATRDLSLPQATYGLAWNGDTWRVETASDFEGIVQIEDLEEGRVVASRSMDAGDRWTLDELDLSPGRQYRLRGGPSLMMAGGQTFRALSPSEQTELRDLQIRLARSPQEHLQRMDQFARLGLFHRSAQEGEALLQSESSQIQKEAILQAVYDIYETVLQDKAAANYWLQWGRDRNLSVQP